MTTRGDDWTESEEQTLRNNWSSHTAQEIADMLPGRTVEAVYSKHQRMKDGSNKSANPVREDEIDLVGGEIYVDRDVVGEYGIILSHLDDSAPDWLDEGEHFIPFIEVGSYYKEDIVFEEGIDPGEKIKEITMKRI